MLSYELVQNKGLLIIQPEGPLRAEDFEALGQAVDEYIVNDGTLNGVMISARAFPGWEDFNALLSHVKFIRANNADIDKVAAVTDSTFLTIMPKIANLFISAEVRHFDFDARDEAMDWITSGLAHG